MNNELNSVEDIDALLDKEFNLTESNAADGIEETDGNVDDEYLNNDDNQDLDNNISTENDDNENNSN